MKHQLGRQSWDALHSLNRTETCPGVHRWSEQDAQPTAVLGADGRETLHSEAMVWPGCQAWETGRQAGGEHLRRPIARNPPDEMGEEKLIITGFLISQ